MRMVPIMWAVWALLVLVLVGLKLYSMKLTRDEDDHLILDEAFDQMKAEQANIVAKDHRIEPLRTTAKWLVVAATIFVAGYYVMDVLNQFK
jgi:hypothetical protein